MKKLNKKKAFSILGIIVIVIFVLLMIGYLILRQMPSYKPVQITMLDGVTYQVFDDHAEVLKVKKDCSKNITIRDTVLGRDVTVIGEYAFHESNVESVKIPDTVEIIDEYAFCICSSLKSVSLGNGVKEIRSFVFEICPKLKTLEFPESLEYIGQDVCAYGPKSLIIPKSVKEIDNFAFGFEVQEVVFEGDDVNIHSNVYYPEGYDDPEIEFFTLCHSLLSYNKEESKVIQIPDDVYYVNCTFPEGSAVYLPDSVTAMDLGAVLSSDNMTVYIPESVTNIYCLHVKYENNKIYVVEGSEAQKALEYAISEYGYSYNYEVVSEIEYPE